MKLNFQRARKLLAACNLRSLFIEELGWDNYSGQLELAIAGAQVNLSAVAQKRGMVAWQCSTPPGQRLPDHAQRRRIEHQVAKAAREHLIVFTDSAGDTQIWQWVKREPKLTAFREHPYHRSQSGDALLQKLEAIAFSFEEEESLSLIDVTRRARIGFDVERVTKHFYDQFKKEHATFLKLITGITEQEDREWYASLMLNRLMFIYFIQRKGFLDGDPEYLRNRLQRMRTDHGNDKFYSFYRYFLLRLFHEGLGASKRTPELEKLVGKIPYLNGGLFDIHELERPDRYGKTIAIPDKGFERIFDFFDKYQWHLDERPLRGDNEINPDVLGYIFEKYVNQKQMGAYYTKEDITEYISKNTVLPFLLEATRSRCKVAFENNDGPTVWDLLKNDPERFIYAPVRHGISWDIYREQALESSHELPPELAIGLNPSSLHQPVSERNVQTVKLRREWNRPALPEYALPTEIWREVVARRGRFADLKARLVAGEVRSINDLITFNLNIRQFAQDVIQNCEGPELLRAFWHSVVKVTILDPTCGSGAFLFAALNILEPLYESCLDLMEAFVGDLDRSGETRRPEMYSDFRKVLSDVATHPNRRYFIFKSIILNNLYGVDIMEEAVEICKLRLFLKLMAQVDPDSAKHNLGIEPLPDIDFNIRAGNTLVGFSNFNEAKRVVTSTLDFDKAIDKIQTQAADLQLAFDAFRACQTEGDGTIPTKDKPELQRRLMALDGELNRYLARKYGVDPAKKDLYAKWLRSHQPFHWLVEFYGIMRDGGFDVIIGNPPFVVNTPEKVAYRIDEAQFQTHPCKNLYAFVYEQSTHLSHRHSFLGLIVQLTALSSEKMSSLQEMLLCRGLLVALSFPRRPESIFDGVEMPVAILLSREQDAGLFTTRISRFYTEERPQALSVISLGRHQRRLQGHRIGKLGTSLEDSIVGKLEKAKSSLETMITASTKNVLYYQEACRYWVKACKGYPYFRRNGKHISPPHGRTLFFDTDQACSFAASLMNSSLFYWFYSSFSDCEHINDTLIRAFPVPASWNKDDWVKQEKRLSESLKEHSRRKTIKTKQGHTIEFDELDASQSKEILDEIDTVLARHYHLTEEELDFVMSYDIKYRMGPNREDEDK